MHNDDGTGWECARVAAIGRRQLSEALLEREEGEASVAFFRSREESEREKEWGQLWFALREGRWRRALDETTEGGGGGGLPTWRCPKVGESERRFGRTMK
jgi:hypothetical protein